MSNDRPYTSAMEFDGDWRGVFIQGQDALMHYAAQCDEMIGDMAEAELCRGGDGEIVAHRAIELLKQIRALMLLANHHDANVKPYRLKPWKDCIATED